MPVSRNLGEAVQNMVVAVPFTVVPNVVDTLLFSNTNAPAINKRVFTFLHVSTLNYQKNPQAIVRAYQTFSITYPQSKLVIIGQADDDIRQYPLTLQIPPENIQFVGLVSYAQVAAVMHTGDALVMFSRYENLPCVILEALCSGLPVISTNVGGIAEVIDGSTGILINGQNEQALLQAMVNVYENYAGYAKEQISKKACEKFCYDTVANQIVDIYKNTMR